jgi:hypothetical protein
MQTYHVTTKVADDGTITIEKAPFQAGDEVEVIVHSRERKPMHNGRYPLRGKPVHYVDPFGSVAEDDWDALR